MTLPRRSTRFSSLPGSVREAHTVRVNRATMRAHVTLMPCADIDSKELSHVDPAVLLETEADVYWCLTKLLDGIQDHFTPAQPGIQRMIYRLRELVHRIDEALVTHLESNGVEFYQFAFRWMNCLLMRELPFRLVIRLWDTCLAEQDGCVHAWVRCACTRATPYPRAHARPWCAASTTSTHTCAPLCCSSLRPS